MRYAATGTQELASAEKDLADAGQIERRQPLLALAGDLTAAKIAADALDRERDNTNAQKLYNFAVARSVENLQRAQLEPWRRPINVSGPDEQYVLTTPRPVDAQHDPSKYDLFPTDALRLGGKFFKMRSSLEGIGAPLVAVERGENTQFRQSYELPRVYAPVTAVVKFHGQRAQLEFIEPFVSDRVKIDNGVGGSRTTWTGKPEKVEVPGGDSIGCQWSARCARTRRFNADINFGSSVIRAAIPIRTQRHCFAVSWMGSRENFRIESRLFWSATAWADCSAAS